MLVLFIDKYVLLLLKNVNYPEYALVTEYPIGFGFKKFTNISSTVKPV